MKRKYFYSASYKSGAKESTNSGILTTRGRLEIDALRKHIANILNNDEPTSDFIGKKVEPREINIISFNKI